LFFKFTTIYNNFKRRRYVYGLIVLYFEIIKYKSTNANEIKIIAAIISNVVDLGPK